MCADPSAPDPPDDRPASHAQRPRHGRGPAADPLIFLLADPARPDVALPILAVFAHPDDETIALGGQLPRLADLLLVHVTDGAPADGIDARASGFDGPAAYAAARRRELHTAVALAGVPPDRLVALGLPDKKVIDHIPAIARRLAELISVRRPVAIVTHCVEGGHPDHDATAAAVHLAAALVPAPPPILEVPLYRPGPDGPLVQDLPDGPPGIELPLPPPIVDLKRRMFAAHATQARVLSAFRPDREIIRPAPPLDFRTPPNGGCVNYPAFQPDLTTETWLARLVAARAELGLP